MKSGLFVAIAIFITIYITVLDIVLKCYCQIVNGTLPYCRPDVFAISGAIEFPCFILLLRCVETGTYEICVRVSHARVVPVRVGSMVTVLATFICRKF